jgi:hypothetical protein
MLGPVEVFPQPVAKLRVAITKATNKSWITLQG